MWNVRHTCSACSASHFSQRQVILTLYYAVCFRDSLKLELWLKTVSLKHEHLRMTETLDSTRHYLENIHMNLYSYYLGKN